MSFTAAGGEPRTRCKLWHLIEPSGSLARSLAARTASRAGHLYKSRRGRAAQCINIFAPFARPPAPVARAGKGGPRGRKCGPAVGELLATCSAGTRPIRDAGGGPRRDRSPPPPPNVFSHFLSPASNHLPAGRPAGRKGRANSRWQCCDTAGRPSGSFFFERPTEMDLEEVEAGGRPGAAIGAAGDLASGRSNGHLLIVSRRDGRSRSELVRGRMSRAGASRLGPKPRLARDPRAHLAPG